MSPFEGFGGALGGIAGGWLSAKIVFGSVERRNLALVCLAALAAGGIGIGWGLPSSDRTDRVFPKAWRDGATLGKLASAHQAAYGLMGSGKRSPASSSEDCRIKADIREIDPLLAYPLDTYLLFSHHPDEGVTLLAANSLYPRSAAAPARGRRAGTAGAERTAARPRWRLNGGAYVHPLRLLLRSAGPPAGGDLISLYERPDSVRRIYLLGRGLSLAALLLCCCYAYRLGRLFLTPSWACWSAVVFAWSPGVVAYAHILKPHLWVAWLCLASLYHAASGPKHFWRAWVFLGLAAAGGLHAGAFLLPVALAAFCARSAGTVALPAVPSAAPSGAVARGAAALILLPGLFFAVNADLLVAEKNWFSELRWYLSVHPFHFSPQAWAVFYWSALRPCLGPPLLAAVLLSTLFLIWRGSRVERALAGSVAAIFLYTASQWSGPEAVRFFLAPCALLCVLTARALERAPRRARPAAAGLLLVWAAYGALGVDLDFVRDGANTSNEALAAAWIQDNVPAGASIGMTQPVPTVDAFPAMNLGSYDLVYLDVSRHRGDPDVLPQFYVLNPAAPWPLPPWLDRRYALVREFNSLKGTWLGAADIKSLSLANFEVRVYRLIRGSGPPIEGPDPGTASPA